MKIFISWSKTRSREIATALREWLPDVIQSCEPWMSNEDIEAGQRWSAEIEASLDASAVGIICVTPENQKEPWLNFEAGAISKKLGTQGLTRVAPYALGMKKEELRLPLGQFQTKLADHDGTFDLLQMINRAQPKALPDAKLKDAFEKWWPNLHSRLRDIATQPQEVPVDPRGPNDKMDELVGLSRTISQRLEALEGMYARGLDQGQLAMVDALRGPLGYREWMSGAFGESPNSEFRKKAADAIRRAGQSPAGVGNSQILRVDFSKMSDDRRKHLLDLIEKFVSEDEPPENK